MIKAVIFDFGGVLGSDSDNWDTNFVEIKKLTGLNYSGLEEFFIKHWPKLRLGQENTSEFWQDIITSNNLNLTPDKLEKIYTENITVDNQVLKIAKNLKSEGFVLALMPNAAKQWLDYKIKKFELDNVFDKFYSSASLAMFKPEREIYEYAIKDLGVAPEEILFIDNHQGNVDMAETTGIKAILFTNTDKLKVDLINANLLQVS